MYHVLYLILKYLKSFLIITIIINHDGNLFVLCLKTSCLMTYNLNCEFRSLLFTFWSVNLDWRIRSGSCKTNKVIDIIEKRNQESKRIKVTWIVVVVVVAVGMTLEPSGQGKRGRRESIGADPLSIFSLRGCQSREWGSREMVWSLDRHRNRKKGKKGEWRHFPSRKRNLGSD